MKKIKNAVKEAKYGIYLNISVTANSKSDIFPAGMNKWRKSVEFKTNSPAKENKANLSVIKTLSEYFDIPINHISIVSGKKNKEKRVYLKSINIDTAVQKLTESIDGL